MKGKIRKLGRFRFNLNCDFECHWITDKNENKHVMWIGCWHTRSPDDIILINLLIGPLHFAIGRVRKPNAIPSHQ